MTTSSKFGFTFLEDRQDSAEDAVNEIANFLQAMSMATIVDRDLSAAPGSPADGAMYLVDGTPGGGDDWENHGADLAFYHDGWYFVTPKDGFIIHVDDEDIVLILEDGSWVQLDRYGTKTWAVTVPAPAAADEAFLFYTDKAITISEVRSVREGGTSVTWNIYHGADKTSGTNVFTSNQVTTSTTTGDVDNSGFNDATIPAGRFVWWEATAVSGSVTRFFAAIKFTFDAEA